MGTMGKLDDQIQGIVAAFSEMAAVIEGRFRVVMPAIQQLYDAFRANYKDDGAVYGDTHDGMMRWLSEQWQERDDAHAEESVSG